MSDQSKLMDVAGMAGDGGALDTGLLPSRERCTSTEGGGGRGGGWRVSEEGEGGGGDTESSSKISDNSKDK